MSESESLKIRAINAPDGRLDSEEIASPPRRGPVYAGAAVSILFLLGVVLLKSLNEKLLEIQAGWLVLCLVPLVVGFVLGGYIVRFKGFGVEFDTYVRRQVEVELEERRQAEIGEALGDTGESDEEQLTRAGHKPLVVWATGGKRRSSAEIALLEEEGFEVEEIDPMGMALDVDLFQRNEFCAAVTNLLHGKNYSGGKAFAESVYQLAEEDREISGADNASVQLPVIVYTSPAATERRSKHISTFTPYVASNMSELLTILQDLRRSG